MPSLSSLSSSFLTKVSQRKSDAYLIELDVEGSPRLENGEVVQLAFQYWPETLTDTKATNYQQKEIPGASLPLYQWINGGERLINFTAVFTTDVDLISAEPPPGMFSRGNQNNIVERLKQAGVTRRNADLRAAFAWLRQYVYPEYKHGESGQVVGGKPLTLAPARLRLVMPNSGIGLAGMSTNTPDSVRVIMTQCDITVEGWFPNGLPRVATVDLAFGEIAQIGGTIAFPSRTDELHKEIRGDEGASTTGYKFTPKTKRQGT